MKNNVNFYQGSPELFRLHLAEEPRKFTPKPEVEAALEYWREMNKTPRYWAAFKAEYFGDRLCVQVQVGHTFYQNTSKEKKDTIIRTRHFYSIDGEVEWHDSAHT